MIQRQLRFVSCPGVGKTAQKIEAGGERTKVWGVAQPQSGIITDVVVCRPARKPLSDIRKTIIAVEDPCAITIPRCIYPIEAKANRRQEDSDGNEEQSAQEG